MELPRHDVKLHLARTKCPCMTKKMQALIRVHYVYHTLPETTNHLTNVLVAFPAATVQSETQEHVFSRILVSNYDLYGTARDMTCLSRQSISPLQSRLLVSHFFCFLSIQSSNRYYDHDTLSIRGTIYHKEKEDLTTSHEQVYSDASFTSRLSRQQSGTNRYVARQYSH